MAHDKTTTGTVARVVRDRGFCFLVNGDQDYFLHRSEFDGEFEELKEGQTLRFTPTDTPKGLRACKATRA